MWADAVAMTRTYLADTLKARGYPGAVETRIPDPRPDRFVRLMNSGSERRTLVHRDTRITVEVWNAQSEGAAVADAEVVYDALDDWDEVPVWDGWPSSPYEQQDPESGCPRVVMTCIVRHRTDEE